MRKTRIYLDTSVISFLFADDAPEKQAVTRRFFDEFVKSAVYDVCISPLVVEELGRTFEQGKREQLLRAVQDYKLEILVIADDRDEIQRLTRIYVEERIIPPSKADDAAHIAIATIFGVDVLLSWNYKHLANIDKERLIESVNLREGYTKFLRMLTPIEVIYEE